MLQQIGSKAMEMISRLFRHSGLRLEMESHSKLDSSSSRSSGVKVEFGELWSPASSPSDEPWWLDAIFAKQNEVLRSIESLKSLLLEVRDRI